MIPHPTSSPEQNHPAIINQSQQQLPPETNFIKISKL